MRIKTVDDAKKVAHECIEKLVKGNVVYYHLYVASEYSGSDCYFSPISSSRKGQQKMIFVDDIEKVIRLLLSHPKVEDLRYYEKENMISAVFNDEAEEGKEATE